MFESYNFLILSIAMLSLYFISLTLVKFEVFRMIIHRKIWNYLLAISFLVTAIIGLLLAFAIDNALPMVRYKDLIWYHVEFGIVMAFVSIFHLSWHLRYYLKR